MPHLSHLPLMTDLPLAFWTPGPMELAILAGLALLFFGGRLPEVGRGMGKFIVEFKRGLKAVEEDIDVAGEPRKIEEKQESPK